MSEHLPPSSVVEATEPVDHVETESASRSESSNVVTSQDSDTTTSGDPDSDVTSKMPTTTATVTSISGAMTSESPRRRMRVSFTYDEDDVDDGGRQLRRRLRQRPQHQLDVDDRQTVGEIKELVRTSLKLPTDEISASSDSHERQVLALSFAGAALDDRWRMADVGIRSGATIRVHFRSEKRPSFTLFRRIDGRSISVYRPVNFQTATGSDLRAIASRTSGLPVGVFRLVTSQLPTISGDGEEIVGDESAKSLSHIGQLRTVIEIFDCQTLDKYGLELGCTVAMEMWDGWSEFLSAAIGGLSNQVMENLDTEDEAIAFYQLKTALYVAAHFGHVDLAVTVIRAGVRPDDVVGEHPTKAWAGRSARHVDTSKTPIHEAAEAGQLAILRYFVHQDVCSVLALDGNNSTPLSVALHNKQTACATFLLTKQWSKIPYGKKQVIAVKVKACMRRWADYARNRIVQLYGAASLKSSMGTTMIGPKKRRYALVGAVGNGSWESPLVGHGVQLDGVTPSLMTSKAASQIENRRSKQRGQLTKEVLAAADQLTDVDPEMYFKTIAIVQSQKSHQSRDARRRNGGNRRNGGKPGLTQADPWRLAATSDVAAEDGASSPLGANLRGQQRHGNDDFIDENGNAGVVNGRREKMRRSESLTTATSRSRSRSPSQRRQSDFLRLPKLTVSRKSEATPSVVTSSVMTTRGGTRSGRQSVVDSGSAGSASPLTADDEVFQRQHLQMPAIVANDTDNRVARQMPRATKSQSLPNRSSKQIGHIEKSHSIGNGSDKSPPRRSIIEEPSPTKQQRNNNRTKPETHHGHLNHLDTPGTTVPHLDISVPGDHPHMRVPPGAVSSSTAIAGEGWQRRSFGNTMILTTRRAYDQRRGLAARDYAVQCLTLAQRFDKLSWLGQVRQAVEIAKAGVRRVYDSENHLFVATAGSIGADPQATATTEPRAVVADDK